MVLDCVEKDQLWFKIVDESQPVVQFQNHQGSSYSLDMIDPVSKYAVYKKVRPLYKED